MVTNCPQQIATRRHDQVADAFRAEDDLGTRAMNRVRQFICGIHGHDSLMQFEQDCLFLKCASCGYESPGWELNDTPVTEVPAQTTPQTVRVRAPLAGVRRVA